MRFTAIVPNEEIRFEAEVGPMRPKCEFDFDQTEEGIESRSGAIPTPSARSRCCLRCSSA